ncbi:MAG TPA: LLM class flavin-dependent oxidoreductase, partial [Pseudomonadales bacterium]
MAEAKFSCHLIGADTLLAQCGEILLEKGHQVDGVVTDAPKIARWAAAHGIDVISASSDYGKVLQSRSFDYLFAITHLALIPDAAVTAPRKLAVNFHDGPLPAYAGLNTPMWAIINGETEYGISWHVMAAGIDEGDLLLQQQFPLADDETALSLNTKCFAAALESFPVLIDTLVEDRVSRTTQDLSQRTYFGRQDRPDNFGLLDWRRSAQDLDRLVRGLHTGPYQNNLGVAKAAMGDRLYVVDETEVVDNVGGAAPGTVIGLSGSAIEVACGSGALALKSLRDLTGKEQDVAGILRDLGLREGIELEVPEPALDARRLARSEDFWRQRLRRVEAPDLPYREATPGSAADAIRTVDLPVPAAFVERFGPDAVGAAFQLFLARVCAGNEIYCALPLASAATPLAAALGYTRFRLDPDKPAVEELERSADVIRSTIDKGPWLTDLLARSPELGGKEILTGAAAPALLIGAGNTMADGAPSDAAELSLIQGDAVRLAYRAAVYSESSITSLRRHFEALLAWLASASSEPAAEISLLSSDEWDQLVRGWNRTALEYDSTLTVDRAFAAQVQRTPDAVAVAANGEEVTYRQLDERINAAASALRQRGIGRDMLVGVHVPRSIDLVVATLGVMRAGGAYVPLDPAFPADRIEFMIEDSGMSTIISSASLRGTLPKTGAAVVDVQAMQRGGAQRLGDDEAGSDGLAYVIYTSGSTGRPKGVMLEHRNVINFFAAMDERIPKASSPGVWLAVTSLSFDISVLELFWTLTRGFKVVIYDEHATRKAGALPSTPMSKKLDMGLFMWGNDDAPGAAKYRLLMEGARYFDENGFAAVWTPERHFHAFGGPYPNPAVTGAAVAAITKNVKIRAGSCVVPLHHPVRIAEEWSVVDNLSRGRAAISVATGWHPQDFVL